MILYDKQPKSGTRSNHGSHARTEIEVGGQAATSVDCLGSRDGDRLHELAPGIRVRGSQRIIPVESGARSLTGGLGVGSFHADGQLPRHDVEEWGS